MADSVRHIRSDGRVCFTIFFPRRSPKAGPTVPTFIRFRFFDRRMRGVNVFRPLTDCTRARAFDLFDAGVCVSRTRHTIRSLPYTSGHAKRRARFFTTGDENSRVSHTFRGTNGRLLRESISSTTVDQTRFPKTVYGVITSSLSCSRGRGGSIAL